MALASVGAARPCEEDVADAFGLYPLEDGVGELGGHSSDVDPDQRHEQLSLVCRHSRGR